MNREDVKELFKLIRYIYPNFEVSSGKLDVWTRLLSDQDKEKVFRKAEQYSKQNKFPPTIADLSEVKRREHSDEILKKIEMWEKNAKPRS